MVTPQYGFPLPSTVIKSRVVRDGISAYNAATVTIRDMKLYRAGDARQTVYDVGDVNQDSRIDAADALMALQSSVELISLSSMELELGDVNRADRVNASDALLILQHSVGLITSF